MPTNNRLGHIVIPTSVPNYWVCGSIDQLLKTSSLITNAPNMYSRCTAVCLALRDPSRYRTRGTQRTQGFSQIFSYPRLVLTMDAAPNCDGLGIANSQEHYVPSMSRSSMIGSKDDRGKIKYDHCTTS